MIIIGIIALTLIVGIFVFLKFLGSRPAVPADYIQDAETGGPIEAKYMAAGGREVSAYEEPALQGFSKYTIYYPSELETTDKKTLSLLYAMEAALPYPNIFLSRNILHHGDLS